MVHLHAEKSVSVMFVLPVGCLVQQVGDNDFSFGKDRGVQLGVFAYVVSRVFSFMWMAVLQAGPSLRRVPDKDMGLCACALVTPLVLLGLRR